MSREGLPFIYIYLFILILLNLNLYLYLYVLNECAFSEYIFYIFMWFIDVPVFKIFTDTYLSFGSDAT